MKRLLDFISNHRIRLTSITLVLLSVLITAQAILTGGTLKTDDATVEARAVPTQKITEEQTTQAQTTAQTEPTTTEAAETKDSTEESKKEKEKTKETKPKKAKETKPTEETESTIPFATAIPPEQPADYNAQWNAGYLVAIDNPDTTYQCTKVTLSKDDRDLLERLCMGEFASGGFVGAALIAQAVKNAMCFDGYRTVSDVIRECRYTGSTKMPGNEDCKNAVKYIFDQNKDAVQHRIMYMYNPNLVQSAFHESQNYIMSYGEIRFFDRWGY